MLRWWTNLIAVYACWFACVLGAAGGQPLLGPIVVACHLVLHVTLAPARRSELQLLALAGLGGYLADSALVWAGLLRFPASARWGSPSPVWMVALWLNFATTLHLTLSWLQGRLLAAALLGACAGPVSYYAGARLGAVELPALPGLALLTIGVEWLIALTWLVWLARPEQTSPSIGTEKVP